MSGCPKKILYISSFFASIFLLNTCATDFAEIKPTALYYNELFIIRGRQDLVHEECSKIGKLPKAPPGQKYEYGGCYVYDPEKKSGLIFYSASTYKEKEFCYLRHELAHHYKRVLYPYTGWGQDHIDDSCGPPESGPWDTAAKNIMELMEKAPEIKRY